MTDTRSEIPVTRVAIGCDHGGYELKEYLVKMLHQANFQVFDFGDVKPESGDDYPDFIAPMARAVATGASQRGVGICGSGVGASIAANRVPGVRACLIHENYSAHQGVEDDNINVICLGGLVVGRAMAWELVKTFLAARFSGAERHVRRLAEIEQIGAKVNYKLEVKQ
jgi:ribose 5-phosphate isomerase B